MLRIRHLGRIGILRSGFFPQLFKLGPRIALPYRASVEPLGILPNGRDLCGISLQAISASNASTPLVVEREREGWSIWL